MGFDVIGDVHGEATKLRALLRKLGYVRVNGSWRAPAGRQAVFVGDLIDRGPEQVEVVDIVRRMVDAGHGLAVMGNHELNAVGYATERPDASRSRDYLRPHSRKNRDQHKEFLAQVGWLSALHLDIVNWLRTLPVALDLGVIRVVHAWWDQAYHEQIEACRAGSDFLHDELLHRAFTRGTAEWEAMEGLTKGLEIELPAGVTFIDHSGVERSRARTRWWLGPAVSYRDVTILDVDGQDHAIPDVPLPPDYAGYEVTGAPVFVGHYWLQGTPALQSGKLACLDYSVAKGGPLVAYRWDGEAVLSDANFEAVSGS